MIKRSAQTIPCSSVGDAVLRNDVTNPIFSRNRMSLRNRYRQDFITEYQLGNTSIVSHHFKITPVRSTMVKIELQESTGENHPTLVDPLTVGCTLPCKKLCPLRATCTSYVFPHRCFHSNPRPSPFLPSFIPWRTGASLETGRK